QPGSLIQGAVVAFSSADTLRLGGTGQSSFAVAAIGPAYQNFGNFVKTGTSNWTLQGTTSALTSWQVTGGTLSIPSDAALGASTGTLTLNGATLASLSPITSARSVTLGSAGGAFDSSGGDITMGGVISGSGSLTKQGSGTLVLTGANTYTGGTVVAGGALQGNNTSPQGNNALQSNTNAIFNQTRSGTYAGPLSGTREGSRPGRRMLTLSGNSTYTGLTTVSGATLSVNGSLASTVMVGAGGMLMGSGSIGGLNIDGGTIAPGNSIGTLTVAGNFVQAGGVYQVEANAQGQADRINVGGTANIRGGTVQGLAQARTSRRRTTYTILRATGGVSGTYSSVTSNFAFLTPSLSYDANDVFLTLSTGENAFSFGGRTFNQRAVGRVLDQTFGSAGGDYATVLNAIAGLSTTNGPITLDAISGQQYAGFSNAMVQGAQLFLTNFANRAGSRSAGGTKLALAEACVVTCDATTPPVWGA